MSVFISYSHIDEAFVRTLTSGLDELGVEYFLDVKDIEWGGNVTETIADALKACSSILVIVSPASLKSHWVPFEIGQATALGKTVLPLLTHPSLEVPGYLKNLNYKTQLKEALEFFKNANRIEVGEHPLVEIYDRLRKGGSLSGSDRIDLIRQIAEGPSKTAKKYLTEIAAGRDFYSEAETTAALIALDNITQGKPNHNLRRQLEPENPATKLSGNPAALPATIMFWERPGSKSKDAEFELLMKMLKGDSDK